MSCHCFRMCNSCIHDDLSLVSPPPMPDPSRTSLATARRMPYGIPVRSKSREKTSSVAPKQHLSLLAIGVGRFEPIEPALCSFGV